MTTEQTTYLNRLILDRIAANKELLELANEIEDTGICSQIMKVVDISIQLTTSLQNINKC